MKHHDYYDPLGKLTDDMLIVIISSLTIKEAARTSVLSSRWTNLWEHTPCLIFKDQSALDRIRNDYRVAEAEKQNYVKWFNRVLQLSKAPFLKEFSVCFDINGFDSHRLIKWLGYAFSHHVEKLELATLPAYRGVYIPSCTFPKELLGHSSVQHLYDFKSLRALSLKAVNVDDKDLEFFLNNSPLLEQMVIWQSHSLVKLELSGPSLKLKILELRHCDKLQSVKVRNTNLSSFSVTSSWHPTLSLDALPSLADVSIDFFYPRISISQVSSLLSSSLFQLRTLKMLIEAPEKINTLLEFPKLTKLKKLVLGFSRTKTTHLNGVFPLLRVAPLLREFVLELRWEAYGWEGYGDILAPGGSICSETDIYTIPFLKVVKITGFGAQYSDFVFLRYLLKYAISLETLIVDPHNVLWREGHYVDKEKSVKAMAENFRGEVPKHIRLVYGKTGTSYHFSHPYDDILQ